MKTLVNFIIWLFVVGSSGTVLLVSTIAILADCNRNVDSLAEVSWWSLVLVLAFILFYLRITYVGVRWLTRKIFGWD